MSDPLRHHGDAEIRASGLLDFAVNVRLTEPPAWLTERIAAAPLAAYPDDRAAVAAVAARHGRATRDVLLTNGAAEAFVLVARAMRPQRAVCVHPSFTEPEAALRAAGHEVTRLVLAEPFTFDSAAVPDDADLVILGNPTNPTGVLHPAATLASLCRPGRTVVVDEAFMDFVPGEAESLAHRTDLPGLIVVRSLTKMWGLAGLRAGYVLAAPDLVDQLRAAQQLWPVSAPALAAIEACMAPAALALAQQAAVAVADRRERLAAGLTALGLHVSPGSVTNFLLVRTAPTARDALRSAGIAVRRADTFPGLDDDWVRIAVRDDAGAAQLLSALSALPIALRATVARDSVS